MKIKELRKQSNLTHKKSINSYSQLNKLITELREKELSDKVIETINKEIDNINLALDKKEEPQIKKTKSRIIKLIEKQHKLVLKNHYQNMWAALGMVIFGIPLGVSLDNIALYLPMGILIGIVIGVTMDKKAQKEGRQINI